MRVIPNNPEVINNEPLKEVVEEVKDKEGTDSLKTTEQLVNKDLRTCVLSKELQDLFIAQMSMEQMNHNLYNTFANYYNNLGLSKLFDYWKARADEEHKHHQWIFGYLCQCNVSFQYAEVPVIKVDITDKIMPFKATVDRELETTGGINSIMNQAQKEGDWKTVSFLLGEGTVEGELVPEQSEEMKTSMDALQIAKASEDWLAVQESIYSMYFRK